MPIFRADVARTLGDLLLDHLYRAAGGDGRACITIHPARAAVLLAGTPEIAVTDVNVLRDMLHALANNPPHSTRITKSATASGSFDIRPTRSS